MRYAWLAFAAGLTLLSGCIRLEFDLCADDPPHPECADTAADASLDGALDGAVDAGERDVDAGPDAGSDAG